MVKMQEVGKTIGSWDLPPLIKVELKGLAVFIDGKCHLKRSSPDVHVTRYNPAIYLYHANRWPYRKECSIRC